MKNIPIGSIGILQIDDVRYGFRPLEVYSEFGQPPIMKGEFFRDVFQASNRYQGAGVAYCKIPEPPAIKNVIFNDPATVVIWADGTKTVVKCQPGDTYSKETGLALCIAKKFLGNKGNFNEVFKKWIPEEKDSISVKDMRLALDGFCNTKSICSECPLREPVCRCGCGTYFTARNPDGSYEMTDDEIRAAFEVVLK